MPFRMTEGVRGSPGDRGTARLHAKSFRFRFISAILAITWTIGAGSCDRQLAFHSPAVGKKVDSPPVTVQRTEPKKVNRQVRVLLLEGVSTFGLSINGPFKIEDHAGQAIGTGQARGLSHATGKVLNGAAPVLQLGPFRTAAPVINLLPMKSGAVELTVPDQSGDVVSRGYRGSLRIHLRRGGTADVVNVVDMEEYLGGVLSGELPRRFHLNAFKAQAVAARTYAFYQKATAGPSRHWDVKATESSQMYLGIEGEKRSSKALVAVRETTGMVCTWESPKGRKIFCTYYSSTCGGLTQNVINVKGDKSYVPPLAGGVRCTYCKSAKYYRWGEVKLAKKTVTERLLRKASFAHLRSLEYIRDVRVSAATNDGRPVWLVLIGAGGRTAQIRAEDFRLLMGGHTLKSTNFSLRSEPDRFTFYNGKGFGHGLGLCQNGAQVMAQAGRQPNDILTFYYPGCFVEAAYQ